MKAPVKLLPPIGLSQEDSEESPANSLRSHYVLGAGDLLLIIDPSIGVGDQPFMSYTEVIPDGTITVYPIGIINVAGLTLDQVTALVNKLAQKYVKNPQMLVQLVRQRPTNVYVLGQVYQPGLYKGPSTTMGDAAGSGTPGLGLGAGTETGNTGTISTGRISTAGASAPSRAMTTLTVLTALNLAGGLLDSADIEHIKITRQHGRYVFESNLWKLIQEGDTGQDMELEPGDVVYVPKGIPPADSEEVLAATTTQRPVRIWGAVNAPGLYTLGPRDDIYSIIARAGGFISTATTSHVLLNRLNPDGTMISREVQVKRDLRSRTSIAHESIKPGDVVIVHGNFWKEYLPITVQRTLIFGFGLVLIYANARFQGIYNNGGNNGNANNSRNSSFNNPFNGNPFRF